MKIKIIISSSLCLLLVIAGYQINRLFDITQVKTIEETVQRVPTSNSADNSPLMHDKLQDIIKVLVQEYAHTIHQTHIQAKLVKIRPSLTQQLPEPVDKSLLQVLKAAFPNQVKNILITWSKMDNYEQWLIRENKTLIEMNTLSRNGLLWQKRHELFPIAATKIWSEEQDKYDAAQIELYKEIDQLDKAYSLTMSERVERLENSFLAVDNFITDTLAEPQEIHKNTIASVLFGLESVQKELQQLDPIHRQLEIEAIRRQLGFSEDAIIRMSDIDSLREARWSNGYAYMNSREELIASNENISEAELNELRTQFFGNSAVTIAREEASGFYRFQRPRYFGRN